MKSLGNTLLTIAVLGGILLLSALVTGMFTRAMYYKCAECGNLNAKRRTSCRVCGNLLNQAQG